MKSLTLIYSFVFVSSQTVCPTIWSKQWKALMLKNLGKVVRGSQNDPNFEVISEDPCVPSFSKFSCIKKVETHDYCDLVLEAQPGYVGNTMANTSYPTKSKPTGMICKLSFMVRKKGKSNKMTISSRSWRNFCKPAQYSSWTEWGEWSQCTQECGTRTRNRHCIKGSIISKSDRVGECSGVFGQVQTDECLESCPIVIFKSGKRSEEFHVKSNRVPKTEGDCSKISYTWYDGTFLTNAECLSLLEQIKNPVQKSRDKTSYPKTLSVLEKDMRNYAEQKGFQNDDDSQSVAYTPNVQAMEKRLSDLEVRIKKLETTLNGMI